MPARFNYRQITVLNTIFQTGSASAAAEHLNISQPAVSKLIGALEVEFGFKLFFRTGRRLRPTAEAQMLMPLVERALNEMDKLRKGAEVIGGGAVGNISVVGNYTLIEAIATPAAKRFYRSYPNVSLSILSMSAPEVIRSVVNGIADIGISYSPVQHSQLLYEKLGTWGCVCAFSKGHEFESLETISPQALLTENIVTFSKQAPTGLGIWEIFQDAGLELRPNFVVNTTPAALNFVSSLGYVGLVDTLEAFKDSYPDLRSRPLSPRVENQITVFTSRLTPLTGPVDALLEEIKSTFSVGSVL